MVNGSLGLSFSSHLRTSFQFLHAHVYLLGMHSIPSYLFNLTAMSMPCCPYLFLFVFSGPRQDAANESHGPSPAKKSRTAADKKARQRAKKEAADQEFSKLLNSTIIVHDVPYDERASSSQYQQYQPSQPAPISGGMHEFVPADLDNVEERIRIKMVEIYGSEGWPCRLQISEDIQMEAAAWAMNDIKFQRSNAGNSSTEEQTTTVIVSQKRVFTTGVAQVASQGDQEPRHVWYCNCTRENLSILKSIEASHMCPGACSSLADADCLHARYCKYLVESYASYAFGDLFHESHIYCRDPAGKKLTFAHKNWQLLCIPCVVLMEVCWQAQERIPIHAQQEKLPCSVLERPGSDLCPLKFTK